MDLKQTLKILGRFPRLILGLAIMAFASAMQVEAMLGYGSWQVLNHGLTKHLPITLGQASIAVSAVIIAIDLIAKERIGVGMFFNMFMVGGLLDFFRSLGIIPTLPGMFYPGGGINVYGILAGCAMIVVSMFLHAFSVYLYVGAGLGAGPRDTLMVVAMKVTGKDIALCRNALEISALVVGFLLGGSVGIGTVLLSFGNGPVLQFICGRLGFSPKAMRHITIDLLPGLITGKIRLEDVASEPARRQKPAQAVPDNVIELSVSQSDHGK